MKYYQSHTLVFWDGKFIKASEAKTGLFDQSIHYGNAVFEGIRSYNTPQGAQIFKAREHFERLADSAEKMFMRLPYSTEELIHITYQLLELNHLNSAYIRPLVYAGPNMNLNGAGETHLMIAAWDWGNYLGNDLLNVMISSYQRPNPKSFWINSKIAGNYVNSILANTEAKAKGYHDAILLDMNGNIAEGSASNFFFEKNGVLFTPPLGHILPGITRATIIELAKESGIEVVEKFCKPEDIMEADGAFFTSTAIEVSGITSLNQYTFRKKWEKTIGFELEMRYKKKVLLTDYADYAII